MSIEEILIHIHELVQRGLDYSTPEYEQALNEFLSRVEETSMDDLEKVVDYVKENQYLCSAFKNKDFLLEHLELKAYGF